MPEGIYKGLLTTKDRGLGLVAVEQDIRAHTDSEDHVLFLDNVPFAYMMTDAIHLCPVHMGFFRIFLRSA